jgi:hypothetical protein
VPLTGLRDRHAVALERAESRRSPAHINDATAMTFCTNL